MRNGPGLKPLFSCTFVYRGLKPAATPIGSEILWFRYIDSLILRGQSPLLLPSASRRHQIRPLLPRLVSRRTGAVIALQVRDYESSRCCTLGLLLALPVYLHAIARPDSRRVPGEYKTLAVRLVQQRQPG